MWIYILKSGELLSSTGKLIATGYSGLGIAKNDPEAQHVPNMGPIPVGRYAIEAPKDTQRHGPYALPLTPYPDNEMFGRSLFLIHGDNVHTPGTASEGCIILPRAAREAIWQSGDHGIEVLSGIDAPVMGSDLSAGEL